MAKLQIKALEGERQGETLVAQFNPKEIEVDRAVVWQAQFHQGRADLEFEKVEPARMAFELLFDGVKSAASVQPQLQKLQQFSAIDAMLHRPTRVKVSWGTGALPDFDGVIEAVSVRYTVFSENGVPLRATASLKLREAPKLNVPQ